MNIQEIKQQFEAVKAEAWAAVNKAQTEKRDLTADEKRINEERLNKLAELRVEMEAARMAEVEQKLDPDVINFAKGAHSPKGDNYGFAEPLSDAVRPLKFSESAVKYLGVQNRHGIGIGEFCRAMVLGPQNDKEKFALSEGTDSAGGYTVDPYLSATLIDRLRIDSVFTRAGARVLPLNTAKTTISRIATDPTPTWRAENAAVSESDMTFEGVTLQPRTLAVIVRVSRELLEDSININEAIGMSLSGAMAAELDRVTGWGSGTGNEPRGIANTSGILTVTSAANGDVLSNYSKLLDAVYQLETNAVKPNAVVMSPREARTIAGFTDTTGQPLRKPDALTDLSFYTSPRVPINQTQGTSSIASSILVGDFSRLLIGLRSRFRIEVLKERYADNLQYGFLAWLRADVAAAQPKAFAKISGIVP